MSFAGKVITCKAAVLWEAKKPLTIEDVEVSQPKTGEVRIKIISTGLCHSDAHIMGGAIPLELPIILGHEGAGIVESVGEGVTSLKEGDHVIPLWMRTCGECKFCLSPHSNLCMRVTEGFFKPTMKDGTKRFTCKGTPISHFAGVSSFSQYTVCSETDVVKVMDEAPLTKICLIGCGVSTGYGAAINTAEVKPGSTCAVWGLGGVGLAAVMGCRDAGASRIIGVDVNPEKFEMAKTFGVTECLNPKDYTKPIQEVITELTDGGCDYTFEAIGNVVTMRAAFESSHQGWGKTTIIGVAGPEQLLSINPFDFLWGKQIKGSFFGGFKSREDVPKLVEKYMKKELMVDEFISYEKPLKEINEGFDLMHQGKAIRTVVILFD